MFFAPFKQLHRNFAFRLGLWYALLFAVSTAALLALVYALAAREFARKDEEIILSRLKEYAVIYQTSGVAALKSRAEVDNNPSDGKSFYVRLNTPQKVVNIVVPDEWNGFKLGQAVVPPRQLEINRIPKNNEQDYTLISMNFQDGTSLSVGRSTNNRDVLWLPLRHTALPASIMVALLGVIFGTIFAHRAMLPVRQIVATARRIIQTGDLDARVPTRSARDEFDELVRLFNTVLDKNQSLIKAMRDSMDNVAHDLRTPLTRLRGSAEAALQNPDPTVAREALADSVEESERVLSMLTTLMDIAEAEAGTMPLKLESVDLCRLIREVAETYQYVAEEKKVGLSLELPESCLASVDANRMRQAFGNLLDNSIKYTPESGKVRVSVNHRDQEAIIKFRDNGMGIPDDEQNKIWDRLFRGDKSRSQRGLGLGLSVVKAVVQAHQGKVSVSSEMGVGSEFTIVLPATEQERGFQADST